MQPSSPNAESLQQKHEENGPLNGSLWQVGQTGSKATQGRPDRFAGLPHRFTLPFTTYSGTNAVMGKRASSGGLLRHGRLISYSDVKQNALLVSASIPKETIADVDTIPTLDSLASITRTPPFRNARHDLPSPETKQPASQLDSVMMFSVRPRESGLGHWDRLVDTLLIEDITQQATLTLPAVARTIEQEDQLARHKDITALADGAAIAGIGDLSFGLLRYVTNVAMTHMVSPAVYGIFGEVYTAVLILGWMAKLGFDGVLIRLLPAYRVRNERELAGGLTRFATWITLISGLLISVLFFAFAPIIAQVVYHDPFYRLPLQEVAPLIPLMAYQVVLGCGLQAFKEIKWKVYMDRLSQPLITLAVMVVLYLLGWRMEALIFSAISGYVCSASLGHIIFSRTVKCFVHDTPRTYTPKVWSSFAVPLLFNGLIQSILNSTDVLFLSIFAAPVQAGIYIAADKVSYFVVMPLFALNMIFSPLIGEYHANRKYEQLAGIFKMVTKWSFSLSLPVFLCCLIFRDAILGVFGPQYTDGVLVLLILCFGNLVDAGTGSVTQLLVMTGRLRIILINSIVSVMVNIGLSFMLVQHFGILGAALASALAVIVINGLSLIEVYWIMKIHPYRWDICKPLLAGGAAYLVGVLLLHLIHLGSDSGYLASIEKLSFIIPFVLAYVLVLVLLRFSEEDQIVFDAVRAKFGRRDI